MGYPSFDGSPPLLLSRFHALYLKNATVIFFPNTMIVRIIHNTALNKPWPCTISRSCAYVLTPSTSSSEAVPRFRKLLHNHLKYLWQVAKFNGEYWALVFRFGPRRRPSSTSTAKGYQMNVLPMGFRKVLIYI